MDCKDSVIYIKQLIKGVFFCLGVMWGFVGYLRVLVLRVFVQVAGFGRKKKKSMGYWGLWGFWRE